MIFRAISESRKIPFEAIFGRFWSLGALSGLAEVGWPCFLGSIVFCGVHFGPVPTWQLCGYKGPEGRWRVIFRHLPRPFPSVSVIFRDLPKSPLSMPVRHFSLHEQGGIPGVWVDFGSIHGSGSLGQ